MVIHAALCHFGITFAGEKDIATYDGDDIKEAVLPALEDSLASAGSPVDESGGYLLTQSSDKKLQANLAKVCTIPVFLSSIHFSCL